MKEVPIKTLKDLHFACKRFDKCDEPILKDEFLNTFWEMFSCNPNLRFIETDMTKIFDEETLNDLKDKTLLKRLGTPEDIAKSVSFLASKGADYITGQILSVSGGFVV